MVLTSMYCSSHASISAHGFSATVQHQHTQAEIQCSSHCPATSASAASQPTSRLQCICPTCPCPETSTHIPEHTLHMHIL